MSEKVKLIIELSKEDLELICKTSFVEDERTMFKQSPSDRQKTMMLFRLIDSVKDGIPLEDVKAEMEKEKREGYDLFKQGFNYAIDTLFYILDNIGKGDSE